MLLPPAPPSARSQGGGLSPSPPRLPHGSLLHARTHYSTHVRIQKDSGVWPVCVHVCVCVRVCVRVHAEQQG